MHCADCVGLGVLYSNVYKLPRLYFVNYCVVIILGFLRPVRFSARN